MTTFREMIQNLDTSRKARFEILRGKPSEELGAEELVEKSMAPITSNKVFLMPFSEPFFEDVYPALQELGARKKEPAIHFGIAGTRNLSIIGATKADAAIFADLNLNEQSLMEAIRDVARTLEEGRGPGNYGPEDFVKEFYKHRAAQTLLKRIPKDPQAHNTIPIDLAEELIVPESWLFKDQKDGRFQHIMKLFSEDKIATIALNIIDTKGYQDLALVLQNATQEIPSLRNAKVSTVFLSNLLYFLSRETSYDQGDYTPRNSGSIALRNISIIAPDNPYTIFAKQVVAELQEDPESKFFNRAIIDGPEHAKLLEVIDEGERELLQQVMMGGRLAELLKIPEICQPRNQRFYTDSRYDKNLYLRQKENNSVGHFTTAEASKNANSPNRYRS